jgi:hypothetical protein
LPTDASDITENKIMVMLGGMMMAIAPDEVMSPKVKRSSYPFFISAWWRSLPRAATVAELEPEIAPNNSAAATAVTDIPPGTRPTNAEIQLIRRAAMPP